MTDHDRVPEWVHYAELRAPGTDDEPARAGRETSRLATVVAFLALVVMVALAFAVKGAVR